ncbi:MAG: ABC transporter permease [SAR202 cluster bacterium]|nr:ABC transporter permease [SAR202 cluster bacterium]
MPTTLSWASFILSFGFGGLCFIAFLLPPILRTSRGIVTRRRYLGRPESVTFIQRYYLDLAFLFICSVLLYEIQARGQLSSGGLEKGSGINEALLFVPILLLFSVAILSFRIFPLLVKFMTGESSRLVLLMGIFSVIFLSLNIFYDLLTDSDKLGLFLPVFVLLLLLIGLLTCFKVPNKYGKFISFTFIVGASLIYGFYASEGDVIPLSLTKWGLVFSSILTGIFFLLSSLKKYYPPWVSLILWNMSRNPLQYTWLVVLLVLSSGVAVLSATLGSTLDHSYRDKIAYDVGSDARIVFSSLESAGLIHSMPDGSLASPSHSFFFDNLSGVHKFSKAKRGIGNIGQGVTSFTFDYLAFETGKIDLWGREDFSAQSTDALLANISNEIKAPAIEIPIGATELGINVKPDSNYPLVSLWLILRDANLKHKVITMGTSDPSGWSKNKATIPDSLAEPIQLVSVQISEPGFGASGTPGKMFFDDLFAVLNGEEVILEDFEDYSDWVVIPTTNGPGDSISIQEDAAVSGRYGFSFEFGKEMNNGVRGLFWGTYGSYLPVLVSQTFIDNSGFGFGDYLLLDISQTLVIAKITGVVDFFPTLNPGTAGFLIADLDPVLYLSSLTNPHALSSVNEIFLDLNDPMDDTMTAISNEVGRGGEIYTTKGLLEKLDSDPLISAGWKLMSSISITVALYIAVLGYFIHMIFMSGQIKSRMGTLRSLGMTLSQSFRMIFVEQVLIILLGVGLGTWTGVGMTRLMVSAIATTDNAVSLVPPALITIDFFSLLICAGIFFALFTFMVIWISFYFFRLNLGTLSRLED